VLLAALLLGAAAVSGAQTALLSAANAANQANVTSGPMGSITGRLTDLHSVPLAGACVVVRNEATRAEARTTTAKNGSYRFAGLAAGEYSLDAEIPQLGHGRLEGIYVSGGHEARVQAAMTFEPVAAQPVEIASGVRAPLQAPGTTLMMPGKAAAPLLERQPVMLAGPLAASAPGLILVAADKTPSAVNPSSTPNLDRLAAEQPEPIRTTSIIEAAAPLTVETPRAMLLRALALPGEARVMPETTAVVLGSEVASEPVLLLGLRSHQMREMGWTGAAVAASIKGLTGGGGPAVRAAMVSAVQMGIEFGQPAGARIEAATREVDSATPAVATTVSGRELQTLPAAGRRWQDFVPDMSSSSTTAGGGGQEPAETSVDGASTRMAFGGDGGSGQGSQGTGANGQGSSSQNGMGQAWAAGQGLRVAEAAIREVQTAAGSAEAEGMRTAGGRVNVETARGSNGLHGQGFLFDRQNTWGAQNPFTQWVKQTGLPTLTTTPMFTAEPYTPPDHEMVWGAGLGSQIRRDKLFWFGALDSYDRNDPGLAMVKQPDEFFAQPSNDQMQVLSARLGLGSANPVAEGLNAYSQMLSTLDGLLGPAPRRAAQWVGFGRVDWQAAERHRFTLEGIGARWNSPGGGLTRVSEAYGTNSFGASRASEELLMGRWEAFLTSNLLSVFQGSAGRTILSAHTETPSAYENTFLAGNAWGQLPQMVVDSRYGFTIGNPSRFGSGSYPDERVSGAQEAVDWVRGSLLVKSGLALSHNADATSLLRNQTGTYSYSSVENLASDALVFAAFGLGGQLNPDDQHNCDQTGKVWRDSGGNLRGLGALPCYSYYSQVMGPTNWNLSTNDWAGFTTIQWQARKLLVVSGGLRWEREQLPPPLANLANPELPQAGKMPELGNDWGPRLSLALGSAESRWPVLRLGYGMYFGRTENATLETAMTQTGSMNGDLNFFLRPTDNLNAGGAPPFPYVLRGEPGNVVKPGAVEFAPTFHNPEVHQAVAAVEEALPGHVEVTASALLSLGRRLPVSIDTNFDPAVNPGTITYAVVDCPATFKGATVTCSGGGPIKTPQITVPFYASWPSATAPTGFAGRLNPDYQQISAIMSRANSTYEAAMLKFVRYGPRGLSLHAHYTYSHAMDWNPNESTTVAGSDVLDPAEFSQEYGTSNLDVRHSAAVMAVVDAPWKLRGAAGRLANGWMVSGIGQFHSGMPYTMRTSGSLAEEITDTGTAIVGLGPGMNGSGGDNRVYGIGRNTFRYPATWKADLRLGKKFDLGAMRELELLVESFNLFNHQNVTELETTGYYLESGTTTSPPTLNFLNSFTTQPALTGTPPRSAFGQPLDVNATNFYRERQIQVGMRMRF
jgi:hypothetical protein